MDKILCVDGDQCIRELYPVVLNEYQLATAASVAEALLMARRDGADLYVFDARLPDGTGVGLCGEVRRFDPETPILFTSDAAGQIYQDEAINAGAQACLTKPLTLFDLRATAQALIRQATSRTIRARCLKLHALSDAIKDYTMDLDRAVASPSLAVELLTKGTLRTTCYLAFARAGGSRTEFDGIWSCNAEQDNGDARPPRSGQPSTSDQSAPSHHRRS